MDMVYYELKDSLKDDACPICVLINKNVDNFIDALLYESVNDIKIREDIKNSKGYCNYHAWKLQSFGDPLAHAIIYSDLIVPLIHEIDVFLRAAKCYENIQNFFRMKKESNRRLRRLKGYLDSENGCPICTMVRDWGKQYILSFVEYVGRDKDFREKFKIGGFLCVPHMFKLLDYCGDTSIVREIMSVQLDKFKMLLNLLNEIKRKSDYRFVDEPKSNEERIAWIKAVEKCVGEPGIKK
ncbi:MAG: DUF6062 family protein [Thermoanaerobacterium sp.]|nr:DUF6062 family protein [Thermoanaerobacterium sp.]